VAVEFEFDQVINRETGVQPIIDGVQSDIWILPMLDSREVFMDSAGLAGGNIERTSPYAIAMAADVAAAGIVGGDDGSSITTSGRTFTVVDINPDGMGFAVLTLEEQ
jgi:hypothetical protein